MFDKAPEKRSLKVVNKRLRGVSALEWERTHTGYKLDCGACTNENDESCFCVTGESVVKHCTTAAVVVAGERASNRGIKNRYKNLQQQHICERYTGKETGKNSSYCLHGEMLERQPEMFDKAPEKRSLKVVNKRLRGVSALARPFQILSLIHIWRCRRSTLCRSRWSPYH